MFDPNADPEKLAARAAELALEQNERLRRWIEQNPDAVTNARFYHDIYEGYISNQIARMMAAYAVLKGYVTLEEASR